MTQILVAEDDRFLASAYRAKLTKSGFEVHMAADGEEALKILEKITPDLILLDLVMPVKDGFATLQEIKKSEQLKHIPVIITSNLGQKEDIDKAMSLGANDYVIKSDLSLDSLVQKITLLLQTSTNH